MKSPSLAASAVVCAALLLGPPLLQGQPLPRDPAERASVIAEILEANARQLTLFDRRGQAVGTVGLRDLYNQPLLSPDARHVAVVKPDLDKETRRSLGHRGRHREGDSASRRASRERASNSPAWSPDGGTLAYVALRDGYFGVYRKALMPGAQEELLFRELGAVDAHRLVAGRPLSRLFLDRSVGRRPVRAAGQRDGERKPIEVFRSKFQAQGPRMSPDGRFMSFVSNSSGRNEVYVIPFDPAAAPAVFSVAHAAADPDQGGIGMAFWRRDGKELYYLAADRGIMAVEMAPGRPRSSASRRCCSGPRQRSSPGRPEQRQRQP